MKPTAKAPAPVAIEDQLQCPTCIGAGTLTCITCTGTGEISGQRTKDLTSRGINITDKVQAALRAELQTRTSERDGWRQIGLALFETAFGHKMGGFGAMPPIEVLEAIKEDVAVVEALRDALLGRAWRVRGSAGAGTCDYPLCPHREDFAREKTDTQQQRIVETHLIEIGAVGTQAKLRVCKPVSSGQRLDSECNDWGRWVQARARTGRIEVLP